MDFYNKFDDKYEINIYLRTAIIVVLFFGNPQLDRVD